MTEDLSNFIIIYTKLNHLKENNFFNSRAKCRLHINKCSTFFSEKKTATPKHMLLILMGGF